MELVPHFRASVPPFSSFPAKWGCDPDLGMVAEKGKSEPAHSSKHSGQDLEGPCVASTSKNIQEIPPSYSGQFHPSVKLILLQHPHKEVPDWYGISGFCLSGPTSLSKMAEALPLPKSPPGPLTQFLLILPQGAYQYCGPLKKKSLNDLLIHLKIFLKHTNCSRCRPVRLDLQPVLTNTVN